jgi:glycosyltransferase involved in cell wall biosynthesis
MKVLLIIPGMDEYCDNAHSYMHMQKMGVDLQVITCRMRSTKGPGLNEPYSNMGGVEIHRIFWDFKEQASIRPKRCEEVYSLARKIKPDIILCSQQKNMHLALRLKRDLRIPIVLLVEFAYDPGNPFRLMGKKHIFKFNTAGAVAAKIYWLWLCRHASAIITCYHEDQHNFRRLSAFNTPLFYVPWPAAPTIDIRAVEKNPGRGIYIGALTEHKNIHEFTTTLPAILERTPAKEFLIIGSGISEDVVHTLKKRYPGRINHVRSLPRDKALELIAGSYFAYTPAFYGGWGFFGDCWSMKTPVVATRNTYSLQSRKDSLVCTPEDIVDSVNTLYNDKALYQKIAEGGYERFSMWHRPEAVGEKYREILSSVLAKPPGLD